MPDDATLLATMSWLSMITTMAHAPPRPNKTEPRYDNMYGWNGTPQGYTFLTVAWTLEVILFFHSIQHTTWALGNGVAAAWLTRVVLEMQGERPDWWWRVTLPLFVGYLGLAIGACTGGTRLARSVIQRLDFQFQGEGARGPTYLGPMLLLTSGLLYYVYGEQSFDSIQLLALLGLMSGAWTAGVGLVNQRLPSQRIRSIFTSFLLVDMAVVWVAYRLLDDDDNDPSMDFWVRVVRDSALGVYFLLTGGVCLLQRTTSGAEAKTAWDEKTGR